MTLPIIVLSDTVSQIVMYETIFPQRGADGKKAEKLATCELNVREWVTSISDPFGQASSSSSVSSTANSRRARFEIRDSSNLRARIDRDLLAQFGLLPVPPTAVPPSLQMQHIDPLRDEGASSNLRVGRSDEGRPSWYDYDRSDLVPGGGGGMLFDPFRRGGSEFRPGVPGPFDPVNPDPFEPVGPPRGSIPPLARYDPMGPIWRGSKPGPLPSASILIEQSSCLL